MREYMRAFVRDALISLEKWVESPMTLREIDIKVYEKVYELPLLNVRDAALVARTLCEMGRLARMNPGYLASKAAFDKLYAACYRAETKSIGREVGKRIQTGLALNRSRAIPVIAYVCTSHQNPREEHKALQGRLYVDRYWREALRRSGHGGLISDLERWLPDLMTVQEAVKGPHWLMTAPNCHHALLPIPTAELVRYGSEEIVLAHHPEARKGFRRDMKTDAERRRKRESLRRQTQALINARSHKRSRR